MLSNATFKVLSISAGFKLNESLLLVNGFALLLHSFLELLTCRISVCSVIGIVLLVGLGNWLFRFLGSVLVGTLG